MSRFEIPVREDFYVAAARGKLTGVKTIHKFGLAPDIDTADGQAHIWNGCDATLPGGKIVQHTYSTTADIDQLSSTNTGDTQDITIEGLDGNYNPVIQTVTLTGQTPVTLPTPLLRACRMYNDGTSPLAGYVYLTINGTVLTTGYTSDGTKVRSIITLGDEQTQQSCYTVPAGYDLYITHAWSNIAKKQATAVVLRTFRRDPGGVFRIKNTVSLHTTGNTGNPRPYHLPIKVEEKEDLAYTADVSANDSAVSNGFHGLLIKKPIV